MRVYVRIGIEGPQLNVEGGVEVVLDALTIILNVDIVVNAPSETVTFIG